MVQESISDLSLVGLNPHFQVLMSCHDFFGSTNVGPKGRLTNFSSLVRSPEAHHEYFLYGRGEMQVFNFLCPGPYLIAQPKVSVPDAGGRGEIKELVYRMVRETFGDSAARPPRWIARDHRGRWQKVIAPLE